MSRMIFALGFALVAASACTTDHAATAAAIAATPAPAAPATVSPEVQQAITRALATLVPQAKIQIIAPTPIAGLYQVVAHGQTLYMTGDGRYAIAGDAIDVKTRTPLGNATLSRLRSDALAKLDRKQMVRYAPANPKYTVTVFTDIDCPYCRAFHGHIAELNQLGIAVDYLFWPRSGLGTPSAQKAVDVWCAPDRHAALADAFEGKALPSRSCDSPVAHDFKLGMDLGVDGTPTILTADGKVLGGYVTPLELLQRLRQNETPAAGG